MRLSVIIPVKQYNTAKTRLDVFDDQRAELCHLMLHETLLTLNRSADIHEIVVVTGEARAKRLSEAMGATTLYDDDSGVNQAVHTADTYLSKRQATISLVIPLDMPLMEPSDISFLLKFFTPPACILVVPSIRYDGTNALLRCPPDVMGTSYDDNSYRNHMAMARRAVTNNGLVYVPRMMHDVDTLMDLKYVLQRARPDLKQRINDILR